MPDALHLHDLTGPTGGPLVHDVSLAVPHGSTHVLLGPIHSGKTMVLRHVVGGLGPAEPRLAGTAMAPS